MPLKNAKSGQDFFFQVVHDGETASVDVLVR